MKSRSFRVLAAVVVAALALYLFREPVLYRMGQLLVLDQPPVKANAVVVLGGDATGSRILKAAQLVKEGYAPIVLVSGVGELYGFTEGELAIEFAVRNGYDRNTMVPVRDAALSTADEGKFDTGALRQMRARRFILVTSYSHTARATRVFRRAAPDLEVCTVGVKQPGWNNGRWWLEREGRKVWLMEAMKTIGDYVGL